MKNSIIKIFKYLDKIGYFYDNPSPHFLNPDEIIFLIPKDRIDTPYFRSFLRHFECYMMFERNYNYYVLIWIEENIKTDKRNIFNNCHGFRDMGEVNKYLELQNYARIQYIVSRSLTQEIDKEILMTLKKEYGIQIHI